MTKNPILNALAALAYIILIASVIFFAGNFENKLPMPFAMITVLSMLTLSAAVMGYIFFSQPLQMIIEGKKKQGVDLFVKTVGSFAVITAFIFISIFLFVK